MTNEVARVVYTPTTAIAKEQLEQIRRDGNSTPSVVFDASNNPGANVQFSGRIDLTKEKQEILIKTIEEKIHNLEKHFNDVQSRQGWIGKSWNWIKNVTGLGAGSDKAQKAIDELKSKIEIAKAHPEKVEEIFREITGQELTLGNLQKLETGELGLKGQERVTKYEQGQGMAKGIFSTIATIGAVTGIMALGIVGTPFTGGMSLGASLAASAAILGTGAAVSVAVNASDAMTSEAKDYSFKQAGKDAISGSVDGALTVATMGLGNAISVGAKTAANSARFAKFGQVLVKPAVQNTVIGASTGVVFGGGGSATEYLLNADEYAFSDFLSATGKGAMNGAVFGGVAGGVGSKFAVLNDKVASKTASMNSRFLAKTLNGTTKGLTTAATGFIGGGVSSEVGYLMDADEVTADGMLEAFTEGGQGGAAMMLGFEGVNGAIMSTPRAKKVLRQKQINSLLEMWGVKPENQAERLTYEKMAESVLDAQPAKKANTKVKASETQTESLSAGRKLLDEVVTSETSSHLGVKGGQAVRNKIIETISAEMFDFLMQRRGKHVSVEEIQAFYKKMFPKLNVEISSEVYQSFGSDIVPMASCKTETLEGGKILSGFELSLSSKSRMDKIKDFLHIRRSEGFYVDERFIGSLIHENVHLMQDYMKNTKAEYTTELTRAFMDKPKDMREGWVDGAMWDGRHIYEANVYNEAPMFYSQKKFRRNMVEALSRHYYSTPRTNMAQIKSCIRGAQAEKQAYEIGDYYRKLFESPRRIRNEKFQSKCRRAVTREIEQYYRFQSKIEEMTRLYYEQAAEAQRQIVEKNKKADK